jgi:anti-sigma B factor antagonist
VGLNIDITPGDAGTYRVKLTGKLDTATYEQFDLAIKPALADPEARAIRLELQDLTYISSMGLGVVVKAKKAIEAKGGVLALIGLQPQVAKVFEIVRMLPSEVVFASREEADSYFAVIQRKVLEGEIPPSQGAGGP